MKALILTKPVPISILNSLLVTDQTINYFFTHQRQKIEILPELVPQEQQ